MKRPPLWLRFLFKLIFGVLLFLLCMQLGRCLSGAPVDSFYEETSTIEEDFEEEVNEVLPTENKKEEIPKANEKETSKTQEDSHPLRLNYSANLKRKVWYSPT